MMTDIRNKAWLADERALEVAPRFAPRVGDPVPRRLNYVAGRTLTERALRTEQTWRDRRFALLGRGLEPGIIEGFEVEVLDDAAGTATLRVSPGSGLARSGEDVTANRPLTVRLDDIPAAEPLIQTGIEPRGLVVLLLQPIRGLAALAADPEDPCPTDTEAYPYADIVTQDGARLVWFRLDGDPTVELPAEEELLRPAPPEGGGEPRFLGPLSSRNLLLPPRPLIGRTESLLAPQTVARNTTARRLIDQEADAARLGKDPPWARFGLPLAILQIDAAGNILFLDRFAVARMGGAPRQATPSAGIGLPPALCRARFDQFVDHLQDLRAEGAALAPASLHFRILPPIGVLPATLFDFETMRSGFFPSSYLVEAAPIPIPQLEAALGERCSLEPYDLARRDYVQIIVPVPEPLYEPRLLLKEEPAREIEQAVDEATIIEVAKQ
ncbi:MAG: hypothetical protein OEU92_35255, partial [Alphaproteobacteria bacterium]|nr:hypothetical protein [Alphaproteobacteria bacterium]